MALGTWAAVLGCLFLNCVYITACPPENVIRPCSCDHSSLVCYGVTEQSVLDGVFRRLGNIHLDEFVLDNSQVDHLISSTVSQNSFQRIQVVNSVLVELFDKVPSSQNELSQLRIENVTIQNGLRVEYLKPLQELTMLFITRTVIPNIGKEFSMSLSKKIKMVALSETKTVNIDSAFVGKAELEEVHIRNASLTSINRFSLPYPSTKLWRLSFDGNQIDKLEKNQFESMTGLRSLSLSGNKVTEVSEEVFGEIYDQLNDLNLSGNPIKCDCSIYWLTRKINTGKTIKGECVEPYALSGKKIVDLKISDFASCPE